ncbi:MAG TPA: tetratricopeptide repeat protein [Xanthomonadales bacterium]|nr:tetratricopeptide repeat protein [Xanthomonadales bacterium]
MDVKALLNMLETGRDSAMLRLSLATALQQQGDLAAASTHLHAAVKLDPQYSAAWKALGKVELERGDKPAAREAWQYGIEAALKRGDKQAQKEMQVFLKRLDKPAPM